MASTTIYLQKTLPPSRAPAPIHAHHGGQPRPRRRRRLASLASSGKPRTPSKAAAPKSKKVLTPEQRAKELTKRNDRRHAADATEEVAVAAAQHQVTNARVAAATREALCMLGFNPSQHGLVNAAVAAAVSTGSSGFPRTVLPDSPRASACNPVPGFHVYPQASCLPGECSPEVSVVAPSTPAIVPIDLNATPVAAGSSARCARKRKRQTPADQLPDVRNLFDEMSGAGDDDYMQNMIFEGGAHAASFDPDETQSQDGRGAFTQAVGYNEEQAAFMRDQAFKIQHNGKCFNLSHCFRVIKDEEKFKAQYVGLKSRGGKQAVEEVGDGEKARPWGKTNSKKEDKRDAASIALIATMEGMITKKDSREEKSRQEREEQMNAFLEIQRRRLDMEAEKQARMLEMEAEKQAQMLEIEAANAMTKAKEVALASMKIGVEIMKVDLNTVSPRGHGSTRCRPTCSSSTTSDL
ncbi:C2 domain-containing protein [Hordeum vulgare]|nr:C2 domain-containing protein [Hordeum vulgare]